MGFELYTSMQYWSFLELFSWGLFGTGYVFMVVVLLWYFLYIWILIVMEELNELKNLVIQTLEANGQLSNIRAQIRSSVFKIVDEPSSEKKVSSWDIQVSPFHWENVKCQKLSEKENGKELISLIKEFFQFYNMDYTNCVFASEANMRDEVKREVLALKLGIDKPDPEKPLLLTVIERSKWLFDLCFMSVITSDPPLKKKNFLKKPSKCFC